jgi:DNA-binding CsgD family transcriptional regulator
MQNSSAAPERETLSERLRTRGDLTAFLMGLADSVDAESYMLTGIAHGEDRSEARLIASNWIHDAVELAGPCVIAALASGALATLPGAMARPLMPGMAPRPPDGLSGEECKLLDVLGHRELYSLVIDVGRQRLYLLLSSGEPGQIARDALTFAQMRCCYALSHIPGVVAAVAGQNPLTERERECLFWVSEGKTTDEVALILGVSPNTVNSYVTHAVRKVSASNRAMAIATAIRGGYI